MKIGDIVYLKITPWVQNECYCFGDLSEYDYIVARIDDMQYRESNKIDYYELYLGMNEDVNEAIYFLTVEKNDVDTFIVEKVPENSKVYIKNLMRYSSMEYDSTLHSTIHIPKKVAEITLCGCVHFTIDETMGFIKPTPEQIKNLHDMLCIDVELFD